MQDDKSKLSLPEMEEKILKFWEENKVFEKSLERTKKGKAFVFYEGPPTANGRPGIHHASARAFKDIILRFKTMRGFYVLRRAGWDTHGLPVEIEVEKELGFKTKQEIEKFGIGKFNQRAKESVWKYKDEWERATRRLGFWLDFENPYITYEISYIETLWWVIKEIWKKGLLYKDFKSLPWCPRCQTGLSSHELGLGYKKIKDDSVFVKLKIKGEKNEYLLIWTTTPWTLPANVAVAVNQKIEYTKFKYGSDYIWSAAAPPHEAGEKIEVVEKASGNQLLGLEYEPLFSVPREYSVGETPPFKVFAADFVSVEDGTGMVHIASAFGEEDLSLMRNFYAGKSSGKKINYPMLQTVNTDGTMKSGVVGEGKFVKSADKEIIGDLKKRGLLLKVFPHEHDYPFCWRCSAPLLYFAKESWWIKISSLRDKLVSNNNGVNWIPEHIKEGRFGEFLKEARDWAFSRERFWGTPLPVWRCVKCGNSEIIGSLEELHKLSGGAKNRYLVIRHGEAVSNIKKIASYARDAEFHLTLRGRRQVEDAAKKLKKERIDHLYASDVLRTRETAGILGKVIAKEVRFDRRLREINTGIFEGQEPEAYHRFFSSRIEMFSKSPPGGENLTELRKRMTEFVEDMEKKYSGKTILIVSHEYPLWMLLTGAEGLSNTEATNLHPRGKDFITYAEVKEAFYKRLPRDQNREVNLHRPYVDDFELICRKCMSNMKRTPEVADVWFDSGSMPFAQAHYPFAEAGAKNSGKKLLYPADYIVEGVDQTRGWFYTLLAVGTLLGRGTPYKNVISLGHVLDKNGYKMSKSKGNAVDTWEMTEKYGSDAIRWYFYTINPPGEPKRFNEEDLAGKKSGFLMTFWNCWMLFDTYVDKLKIQPSSRVQVGGNSKFKTHNLLDRWIFIKLRQLVLDVTKKLNFYDVTGAARAIEGFIVNDFSQWYLRRSRRRLQRPGSKKDKEDAAGTAARVLLTCVKLTAPFAPFVTEAIYLELRKKLRLKDTSVHLTDWPDAGHVVSNRERNLLENMEEIRKIVAEALRLRAEAGIRVRQPLAKLEIRNPKSPTLSKQPLQLRRPGEIRNELLNLIKEEVNVKEVTFGEELKLDTVITPELKGEGMVREVVRNIQEMRRDLGLKPQNKIRAQFSDNRELEAMLEKWKKTIMGDAGVKQFVVGGKKNFKAERELDFDGKSLWVGIEI